MTNTRMIPLSQGHEAVVDADDYATLSQYSWYAKWGGNQVGPYAARSKREGRKVRTERMHRLLMRCPRGMEVDHLNGNMLDNRRHNLEIVTKTQNVTREHTRNGNGKSVSEAATCPA